ncbi:MAG: type II toxin-antitoxin system HicB family antitoxin [Clostridia bacterium]|nr:type II toxin-antitoxin system HicB family antitoxin [Clostridia bacterium]
MVYLYTAVLSPIEDGSGYYARVPDLPGCMTSGRSLADALSQITDAMSGWLCVAEDEALPISPPTPQADIPHDPGDICSLIQVDTIRYRAATDTRTVRKNVSLPAWLSFLADRHGVNCSQVLQEALREKLGVPPL